jgi:hypothetical protein
VIAPSSGQESGSLATRWPQFYPKSISVRRIKKKVFPALCASIQEIIDKDGKIY